MSKNGLADSMKRGNRRATADSTVGAKGWRNQPSWGVDHPAHPKGGNDFSAIRQQNARKFSYLN